MVKSFREAWVQPGTETAVMQAIARRIDELKDAGVLIERIEMVRIDGGASRYSVGIEYQAQTPPWDTVTFSDRAKEWMTS